MTATAYPVMGFAYPVARVVTPLSERDLARQFIRGHELATGKRPGSKRMLENAVAIICVENGNGRAFICHNWGNIMAGASWHGPFWFHPSPSPGQPVGFRAYSTHDQGSAAWWRLMYRGRHRRALELAALGRPRAMVEALYDSGYVVGGNRQAYIDAAPYFAERYRRRGYFAGLYRSDAVAVGALAAGLAGVGYMKVAP